MSKSDAQAQASLLLIQSGYLPSKVTVGDLAEAWASEREGRIARSTREMERAMIRSMGPLGSCPLDRLEPLAVRQWVLRASQGRHRSTANKWLQGLKIVLRWGVERGVVDWETCYKIEKVGPLQAGEGGIESVPRQPPEEDALMAVRDLLGDHHRLLLDLLILTGARVGELLNMDLSEINRQAEPWVYAPEQHKTSKRGKGRWIFFGPSARALLTPLGPSGKVYPYCYQAFWTAIQTACRRAGVDPIKPHQVRHLVATKVRVKHGPEAARLLLGHSTLRTTDIYSWTAQHHLGSLVEDLG